MDKRRNSTVKCWYTYTFSDVKKYILKQHVK